MGSRTRVERAAFQSLLVTVVFTAAKLAVWIATSSLAVLSQALDSAVDIVALALVFVGVRIAGKPADSTHHYGHAKAENLVAFTETLVLGGVVVAVAIEAIDRLGADGTEVTTPWYALALLGLSGAVDLWRARSLTRIAREERSDALYAGALNVAGDVATAAMALISLAFVRAGIEDADAVGALLVGAVVAVTAVRLGARSVGVLMDRVPPESVAAIEEAAARAEGVHEARRVRVRQSGNQVFADVTVAAGRTVSLERAHDIAESVENEIHRVAPRADVVVHVEPTPETGGLVERAQAAASRAPEVHEVHNVFVHAFTEEGQRKLHVTLHAKVDPTSSLAEAHELSDRIEAEVAHELGPHVRVDSHIEPLEPTALGVDVTDRRPDVVEAVERAALAEADVVDCHEVLVTASGDEVAIVAHVRGRADLPLERIHQASERIEKHIHAAIPDAGPVLIHFEPA